MISFSENISFIEKVFGSGMLTSNKKNIDVKCPICDFKDGTSKKKLSIRISDHLNHCWVCNWTSRSLLPLLYKFFRSYVEEYKNDYVDSLEKIKEEDIKINNEQLFLPKDYKLLYGNVIDYKFGECLEYLKSRNVEMKDVLKFGLGCSNEIGFTDRIIFPSFDEKGQLNYYTKRTIKENVIPKYDNCDGRKHHERIFNEMRIDWKKPLLLVEGPFDLLKCTRNSTCLMGSNLNEKYKLFSKILEHKTDVILCLDSDVYDKTKKIANNLASYGIGIRYVALPKKDPGKCSKNELEEYIEKRSFEWNEYNFMNHSINKVRFRFKF
jgi:hypothetical protein